MGLLADYLRKEAGPAEDYDPTMNNLAISMGRARDGDSESEGGDISRFNSRLPVGASGAYTAPLSKNEQINKYLDNVKTYTNWQTGSAR